jgi:hypothetical protein
MAAGLGNLVGQRNQTYDVAVMAMQFGPFGFFSQVQVTVLINMPVALSHFLHSQVSRNPEVVSWTEATSANGGLDPMLPISPERLLRWASYTKVTGNSMVGRVAYRRCD